MKWTYDWLKDYLDIDLLPDVLADKLTEIGLEIDDVTETISPIVAKIIECKPHSNSDHLHVLMVDDGSGTLRQVVCGAPNARVGLVSVLARPGCKIGDMEIKSGKIRGELSDGMMCSGKELGISDDHAGIIELDEKTEIGKPLSAAGCVIVFDAGITPNRPDYLGVRGIAWDLAASGVGKIKPEIKNQKSEINLCGNRKAVIQDLDACPVYRLMEIHNIEMAPSDATVAGRLSAIGINPKNAPIDATNYICFDMNQPMHCFDADQIVGDIIIRKANAAEKFTDLFGTEHTLTADDLVIADDAGILALAGVVGGARGMTSDKTKNIILESAYFESVGVRKTSRRVGVSTDSSYRYERGIDPTTTGDAITSAAELIMKQCGGQIIGYHVAGKNPAETRKIKYTPSLFLKKTGIDLDAKTQLEILERLGCGVDANGDEWAITPRPSRVDIQIPENIISELIRIYGYENIKPKEHMTKIVPSTNVINIKKNLIERGFFECSNYGFGDSSKESILSDKPSVTVLNPIIDTFDTVRNSLVQSMLDVVSNNDRFRRSNLALFELAPVFDGAIPGQQHNQLIIARTGIYGDKIGIKHGVQTSVFDVRDDLLSIIPGGVVQTDDNPPNWAHPYRAGCIKADGETVAIFAELHPKIAKKFAIKTNVVIGLIDDVDPMIKSTDWTAKTNTIGNKIPLSEFPLITRDFAFISTSDVNPDMLTDVAASVDGRIIETNVFDVFDMGDGKKSIAFEIVIQPTDNMSDSDLMAIQNAVILAVEKKCDAKIRDK